MSKPIDLLNAHFDGRILSAAEAKRLSEWVKADPANARTLVELGVIHAQTDYCLSVPRFINELGESEDLAVQRSIEAALETAEIDSRRRQSGVARKATSKAAHRTARRGWLVAAVAASLLIAVLSTKDRREAAEAILADKGSQPEDSPLELAPIVATITDAIGIGQDQGSQVRRGSYVRSGDQLSFDRGVIAMTTADGSDVVIQGPVSMVFDGRQQIALKSGRLAARISEEATGLVVTTPTAKVVDLGTEFGVGIGPELQTEVAVYDGAVELYGRDLRQDGDMPPMQITAGRAGHVGSDGSVHRAVQTLLNGREFVRPDEIASLRAAQNGSAEALQRVSFYAMQRIPGLMGFQSFDIPSEGAAYTVAFGDATPRSATSPIFAKDLKADHLFSSGALLMSDGEHAYLECDTSSESPLARAELLTDRGHIGRSGTELWIAWKTRMVAPDRHGDHAGLSLMFGDQRRMQEPLFVGYSGGDPRLSIVSNVGSQAVTVELDADPETFAVDSVDLDGRTHQWVLHLIFGERGDKVSVWCDVPLESVRTTRPNAGTVKANVFFDRLRLGVGEGATGCLFDDLIMATTIDSIEVVHALQARSSREIETR